jgi:hypothetical protein
MEPLYQSFLAIPIDAVGFQGMVQMVLIAGAVIFKLLIPAPKKKKISKTK